MLHLSSFTQGIDLGLAHWGSAQGNAAELAHRLRELGAAGYRLVVSAPGHGSLERVKEVVGGLTVETVQSPLREGFLFDAGKLAVATEEDLFGSRRHTRGAVPCRARTTMRGSHEPARRPRD